MAENPIWRKPDWAFLQNGLTPPTNPEDRLAANELGDYSLDLGDGLYIHGTLYTRLLGMNVTHGCIRVGDEALEQIYRTVAIGTPVFIMGTAVTQAPGKVIIDRAEKTVRFAVEGLTVWQADVRHERYESDARAQTRNDTVTYRHFFSGEEVFSEREISVVGEELGIAPEILQRTYPGKAVIILADGRRIEIVSDATPNRRLRLDNFCFDLMESVFSPFPRRQSRIELTPEDALTFYILAQPGREVSVRP